MSDQLVVNKNSPAFSLNVYTSISAIDLVVFAVQVLQTHGEIAASEEVVSTCFRFFPHSFALKNYFYWPDSALVTRHLQGAKEKGFLKGSVVDGFELKGKGKQLAKQTAKVLGVAFPKVAPKPVEKKAEVNKQATSKKVEVLPVAKPVEKKAETKKQSTSKKVEVLPVAKPVEKKAEVNKQGTSKKVEVLPVAKPVEKKAKTKKQGTSKKVEVLPVAKPVEKKAEVNKQGTSKKVEVLPVAKPVEKKAEVNKQATSKKVEVLPVVKPVEKKAKTKKQATSKKVEVLPVVKPVEKKAEIKKQGTSKKVEVPLVVKPVEKKVETKKQGTSKKAETPEEKPAQLMMDLAPATAWKKVEETAPKPKVKQEAPPIIKGEVLTAAAVSKEEKEKAAKVIKQVERSDAYQLYRRNGRRAQIGEFDFRNMLFATMESSPETLKRNVELFKRYAGFHFRADLIAFLEFCEEHFAALLKTKEKKALRK